MNEDDDKFLESINHFFKNIDISQNKKTRLIFLAGAAAAMHHQPGNKIITENARQPLVGLEWMSPSGDPAKWLQNVMKLDE